MYCPMQERIEEFIDNFGGRLWAKEKSQSDHPDAKLLELIGSYINQFIYFVGLDISII